MTWCFGLIKTELPWHGRERHHFVVCGFFFFFFFFIFLLSPKAQLLRGKERRALKQPVRPVADGKPLTQTFLNLWWWNKKSTIFFFPMSFCSHALIGGPISSIACTHKSVKKFWITLLKSKTNKNKQLNRFFFFKKKKKIPWNTYFDVYVVNNIQGSRYFIHQFGILDSSLCCVCVTFTHRQNTLWVVQTGGGWLGHSTSGLEASVSPTGSCWTRLCSGRESQTPWGTRIQREREWQEWGLSSLC